MNSKKYLIKCPVCGEHDNEKVDILKYKCNACKSHFFVMQNDNNEQYNENNVSQDYTEALKWYKILADQGNVEAQNSLGDMYYEG